MSRLIELAHARGSQHVVVVFVHGLGGDPLGTWTSGKDVAAVWPKWLAEDLEGVAVWSVDYEAPMSDWRGSAMELTDRAANVLNLLLVKPDLGEGQLILVGHSLGGLVIKQVLRKAADAATERADAHSFIERVRKVVFLATPHVGADLASWGDRLRVFVRPSAAARSLLRNDSHLRDLNLWYRRWAKQRGIDHLILTETKTALCSAWSSSQIAAILAWRPILFRLIPITSRLQNQQIGKAWFISSFAISSCVKPGGRSRMRKERSMPSRTTHRRSARMSNG
jgi:pimeloyl-ACP methyl ester carboxylesterase